MCPGMGVGKVEGRDVGTFDSTKSLETYNVNGRKYVKLT